MFEPPVSSQSIHQLHKLHQELDEIDSMTPRERRHSAIELNGLLTVPLSELQDRGGTDSDHSGEMPVRDAPYR